MIRVSFIIATYNRRDVLIPTLSKIIACGLPRDEFEIHVVDNASNDGTAEALAEAMTTTLRNACEISVHLIDTNQGSCAKNIALPHARGDAVVFLDDDSYPEPDSIEQMLEHFARDPDLGAATFTVTLPNGARECSAYPNIFIGCGVGFRRVALEQVGGLPDEFFIQAEEYDLSLRLIDAGWTVQTFKDLQVTHLKTPTARSSDRTMRMDVRNNLLVIAKHFPDRWALPFTIGWMWRYWMIASANGQRAAFLRGMLQGAKAATRCRRKPISENAFEQFTRLAQITDGFAKLDIQSVLLADVGKNAVAYLMAARAASVKVVGIADDRLAGRRYWGTKVISSAEAPQLAFDAIVVANSSPVHARATAARWRTTDERPVYDLLVDEAKVARVAA